ncbi:MAG TPA: metallophosphoesterase [Lentimicrobium sp.]|nr:metallophosphoesterase [Lentimicrobium sp.]
MKTSMLLIFFSIVLLVYFSINLYIYNRGIHLIPVTSAIRPWFKAVFWVIVCSYILGRVIERFHISWFTDILTWTGSFWLATMFYFFLLVVVIDIFRIGNYFIGYFPEMFYTQSFKTGLLIISVCTILLIVLAGHINAVNPRVKKLVINVDKPANGMKELKIALASDIHMGTVIGPRRMTKLVNKIQDLKPDLILFAGDVVDEDVQPVIRHNLGKVLIQLHAPLGVYAITGNHEYIGGVARAVKYLEEHNITFLRDTAVKINNSFYLAGREDRSKNSTGRRKEIAEILNGHDTSLPVIMMDHQPFELDKVVEAGVDVQFSGHTHHGQIWPLNYITQAMYEISMGYKQKGNSHFYVSNGYGSWGPPVRIGNRPEIVEVLIKFKN